MAPSGFASPSDLILNYTPAILGSKFGLCCWNIEVGRGDGSDLRDSASFTSPQKRHGLPGFIWPWQYKHSSRISFSSIMTSDLLSHRIFLDGTTAAILK
jgi:hypothetical protein